MKASIEYFVLILISSFVLIFMIQLTGLIYKLHQGHQFLDYITHLINNYDGQMDLVEEKIKSSRICEKCEYQLNYLDNQYEVEVKVPFKFLTLDIDQDILLRGLSVRIIY